MTSPQDLEAQRTTEGKSGGAATDRVRLQYGYFEALLCQQVTGEATSYAGPNYYYISVVSRHIILPQQSPNGKRVGQLPGTF